MSERITLAFGKRTYGVVKSCQINWWKKKKGKHERKTLYFRCVSFRTALFVANSVLSRRKIWHYSFLKDTSRTGKRIIHLFSPRYQMACERFTKIRMRLLLFQCNCLNARPRVGPFWLSPYFSLRDARRRVKSRERRVPNQTHQHVLLTPPA